MKKIILTRHGETYWNVEKRFQGQTDIELNENGKKQAKELQRKLANYKIDKVFSSPSKRALLTAQIAMEEQNVLIVTDERLMEMMLGDWEGCLYDEVHKKFGKDSENFWKKPEDFDRKGVESFENLLHRTKEFVKDLNSEDGKIFLVVSHGLTCRALTAQWDNRDIHNFWERDRITRHCSIIEIEFDKNLNGQILKWSDGEKIF